MSPDQQVGAVSVLSVVVLVSMSVISADFPEPTKLEPNISLWQRVYGEWTSANVAFHDREFMGVVYDVLDLGEFRVYPGPDDPVLRRLHAAKRGELIDARRAEIVASLDALSALARQGKLELENLSDKPDLLKTYRAVEEGGALAHLEGARARLRSQFGLADRFYEGIGRFDSYYSLVVQPFLDHGLPEDLLALAFVESIFHPTPVSHAGAAGMFQFMPATGREYGLARSGEWDMRRDPVLAADAAARMLRRNYQRLGNWPLALTGYNHGPNGVARGVRAVGSDNLMDLIENYESRTWGFASKNFYAQFLAARRVLNNRFDAFGDWVPHPPILMKYHRLAAPIAPKAIVARGCLDRQTLTRYNPALLPTAYTGSVPLPEGFKLWVPQDSLVAFVDCLSGIQ